MKIICDVCNELEATSFCSADEAALCAACDHRVHHANVLAGKHPRFSLIHPSPKNPPTCDICQEKKALLFCQQDRAILCKDCDVGVHKVNEHTRNHSRFLLTGVKLSPAAMSNDVVPVAPSPPIINQTYSKAQNQKIGPNLSQKSNGSGHGPAIGSSISEYLIEMLPGWHVEDFLDSPCNFSKTGEEDPGSFWDDDCFSSETRGIWVPQAPPPPAPPPASAFYDNHLAQPCSNIGFGNQLISGSSLVFAPASNNGNKVTKSSRKRRSDDGNCFTVPQISHAPATSKRSRTLW